MTLTRRHASVNKYKLFRRFVCENPEEENVLFWLKRHPQKEMGQTITFAKKKVSLIIDAAKTVFLHELAARQKEFSYSDEGVGTGDIKKVYFHLIPREIWIYRLLTYLSGEDVARLAQVSRVTQQICYDNLLWKRLCEQEWHGPHYLEVAFNPDIMRSVRVPRLWKLGELASKFKFHAVLLAHQWRLTFVAMKMLSCTPSVSLNSGLFNTKTWECLGTNRRMQYESTRGTFEIRFIKDVGRVEFAVFNFQVKPWHRKEYGGFCQHPIFCLRDVGLLKVRCRREAGYMRRKGYTLQTDLGQRLYFSNKFIPTTRYRLFRQESRLFLLCQDVYIHNGQGGDCYTMYEIIPIQLMETSGINIPCHPATNREFAGELTQDGDTISLAEPSLP